MNGWINNQANVHVLNTDFIRTHSMPGKRHKTKPTKTRKSFPNSKQEKYLMGTGTVPRFRWGGWNVEWTVHGHLHSSDIHNMGLSPSLSGKHCLACFKCTSCCSDGLSDAQTVWQILSLCRKAWRALVFPVGITVINSETRVQGNNVDVGQNEVIQRSLQLFRWSI